jgi:hypothetical protein
VFRPGDYRQGAEFLERRELLSGDLTQDISNLLSGGTTTGSYTFSNVTLGSFLSASSVNVSLQNISQSGSDWSGTVSVSAPTASLAIGQEFTGQIQGNGTSGSVGLSGSYSLNDQPLDQGTYGLSVTDLTASVPNVLNASAAGVQLQYNPGGGTSQEIAQVSSLSATIIPLDSTQVSLSKLDIYEDGFTVGNATVSASPFTLGSFLTVDNPSVSFSGVAYTTGGSLAGTIGVNVGSATLFPGQSTFSATVDGFSGSYDLSTSALTLSAADVNIAIGQILAVDGSMLTFNYSPGSLSIGASTINLSSPDFPGVTAQASNLNFTNAGFSLGSATLSDSNPVKLGGFLQASGLEVDIPALSYDFTTNSLTEPDGGSFSVSASSVSLFPGESAFNATVDGFSGSYDLSTSALTLSATDVNIQVGSVLDVTADTISFGLQPTSSGVSVSISVGSATADLPELNLMGSVSGLTITNDGFMVGSASLAYKGPVSFGSLFKIKDPSIQISNFGYSFSNGASFNSDLTVNADEIDVNQGRSWSAAATGVVATLSFQAGDVGHFTFSASTVNVQLGSYLTLQGSNINFDTNPPSGGDIASFGSVTATVTAGPVTLTGTGQDFAIGADGSFIEGTNFGVALSLSGAGSVNWLSWLPVQVTALSLTWPDFSSDPADFSIDLSASINVNFDNSGLMLSGSVTDAVIDVGKLSQGQFPVTSLGGFSVSAGGDLFGAQVSGALVAGIVNVDSSGNVVTTGSSTPVANSYFYGGIEASLDLAGLGGFTVMLGLSQLGPLDAFVEASVPILLDPDSGLAVTNLYAEIEFDKTLPTLTSAKQIVNNPDLTSLNQLTVAQWQDQLASQVATQAKQAASGSFNVLSEPMVIGGGATIYDEYASTYAFELTAGILFDTTGKIEATGTLTIGDSVSLQGAIYVDLSTVTSGHVEVLTYLQFPSQAPIATVYGSLAIDVTGTASDPATSFTITVTGEVDLTLPDLPGALQIIGSASFTASTTEANFDFSLSGQVNLDPIGNLIDLYGDVHFQDENGAPELWGIFVLTTGDLSELANLGLKLSGTAVLEFNTTSQDQPENITFAGATTPTTFTLPADSVSLTVTGSASFEVSNNTLFSVQDLDLQAYFSFTTDSSGTVHPLLDIYLSGTIDIGPASAPYLQFSTADFLQASDAGLAAEFNVTLEGSSTLSNAGIDLENDTFTLLLNTTEQSISYVPRSITDPTQPGTDSAVNVPAAPSGSSTPQPYFEIEGQGGLSIENSFELNGSFVLVVAQGELEFSMNMQLSLDAGGTTILSFDANGGITISSQGLVAGLELTPVTALPSGLGFTLSASFVLEANTTGQSETIGGVNVPADPQGVTGSYALVQATGSLSVGTFQVNGSFYFLASSSRLELQFEAYAALGPLGQAAIGGDVVIGSNNGSSAGIYGILQAALTSSPSISDVSFNLNFQFEINTTNMPQPVTGFSVNSTTGTITTGQQITIPSGQIEIDAGGSLTIVNMFNVEGQFDLVISSSGLQIDANATLTGFFGINLGLTAELDLSSGGLVVNAGLTLSGSLPLGLLSVSASPQILINTTSQPLDGVAPSTYEVELNNAKVNFLGLQASGSLIVGVSDGIFEIEVPSSDPLQLSFFGLGGVSVYGYIDSNGQFSLTGSVGFQLGQSGNEIWGSLQITISNNGFSGYFGGGCEIFGINIASISGWLTIDNNYIDLGASVSIWIFSFSFNIGIGQLQQPQQAPNSLIFYSVPTTANAGSTISLDASATDGNGNQASGSAYNWTIYYGNAVYAQENGANPSLKLGDPGTYTVVMNEGAVSKTSTIQVVDVPPTVSSLNLQTGYAEGQSVTLAPSVYSPLPEAPGGLHYQWTVLRNGQPFATANTPTYTFTPAAPTMSSEGAPVPDVYQVSLTVSDNYGGSTTANGTFGTFDPNNIVVTTTQDLTQPGQVTSLRVAIAEAAESSGIHYVKFASDLAGQTITLTNVGDSSDYGNSAIRIPSGVVVLDATNAPGVTIAASGGMRIFYVPLGTTLEMEYLNLSGGDETGTGFAAAGGAIYVDGAVYSENCAFVGNAAVATSQTPTSIFGISQPFTQPSGLGGAVYVSPTGLFHADNSTFAGNVAEGASGVFGAANYGGSGLGGAIYNLGSIELDFDTIAGNAAVPGANYGYSSGGGVYDATGSASSGFYISQVINTIVADNSGGVDYDFEGNGSAMGMADVLGSTANLTNSSHFFFGAYNIFTNTNPLLGGLGNHGNGVETFSLSPGSPAIGTATPYGASGGTGNLNPNFDGRGYPRSQNGSTFDIGAFETQPYVVSNTNDSGAGSLRAAIAQDDTDEPIIFAPNLAGQVISLSSGPITITHNLAIQGLGANEVQVVSGTVAPLPADLWAGTINGGGVVPDTSGAAPGYKIGTVSSVPGMVGQAFQFTGQGDVTVPDNQTLDSSSFTIGGWYYLTQGGQYLASKYDGNYHGWILGTTGSNQPVFQVNASPSALTTIVGSSALAPNHWYYLAATYDGTNAKLYVNGQLAGSGTLAGGYAPSATPMVIGGASWYTAYSAAVVEQFAFYSSALTANQVTATYDATLSLTQPAYQGYGIFNVASGVTVTVTGLTLGNGDAVEGGAFNNAGTLTITGSQFVQDSAPAAPAPGQAGAAYGGAIFNATGGTLVVTDSSFINDSALGGEGQVKGSLAGTGGNAYGGAIFNAAGALLGAADDTFAGDYATGGAGDNTASTTGQGGASFGGAIYNQGTAYLVNVTIARNAVSNGTGTAPGAASDGAGIFNAPGAALFLTNSIVAGNTGDDIIVNGKAVAQDTGGNDIVNQGSASGQSNLVTSNNGLPDSLIVSKADPNLAQLLNTGGTTSTLVELPGSPAIGAGNTAVTGLPVFPFSIPGLAAWWQGNDSSQDGVGSAIATLIGGVSYGPGLAGAAFQFNGTTSYAAIPSSADIVGTGAFSISVWVKTSSANGVIIQQRDPNNFNGEYQLAVSNGKVYFWVYGNSEYDFQLFSNASVNDGNWHNIVAVRLSNGTGEIFIDGNLDSTAAGPDVSLGSGFNVYLGADERNAYYGISPDYFNGLIENVALFNTALTSTNVQNIDQGTIAPQTTDERGDPRIYNGLIDIGAVEEQPYEVTNTSDSGPGSLRQEIAEDAAGDQPVIFAPGLAGATITLTSGPITIKNNLVIEGLGANELTISGGNSSQIFVINGGNVSISGLTFTGGLGSQGGAIESSGNVTITNCVFSNNLAQDNPSLDPNVDSAGGAIVNLKGATLIVSGSTFTGNEAKGVATSSNNANAYGGAIENVAGATLSGSNDSFGTNSAVGGTGGGGFGGAIDNAGAAAFVNSTIETNSIASGPGTAPTPSAGAGINNEAGGSLAISNTIVSYNKGGSDLANSGTATGPDIVGLPTTNPAATAITLTGIPSSAGATIGASVNNVWTISAGPGLAVVSGTNLVLNGSDPIALPSGLIQNATTLTVTVTFSTTTGGVILGYQDQAPQGSTPPGYTPALYIGTDGLLRAELWDGTIAPITSTTPVNNGQSHAAVLTWTGNIVTLKLDGQLVGQTTAPPQMLDMSFDQLGTGFTTGWPGGVNGLDPFAGTISSLTISSAGPALAGSITPNSSFTNQITFTPPAPGNYSVGLSSTNSSGFGSNTSQTFTASDVAPTLTISGLPASGAVNQSYTLIGSITDPVSSDTAAGFNDVWTVSGGPGQQAVAASNLVFNGSNPIVLPQGLIHNATSLTVTVTFSTTSGGVILGYQDQPLGGSAPAGYTPALYVGTDGLLRAELWDGSVAPITSTASVKNGQVHTADLTWVGNDVTLTLDGQLVGQTTTPPQMLAMSFDQLGTGFTTGWPAGASGWDPFTGTIQSLSINTGTALQGALSPNPSAGNQASFKPFTSGTYTIGLSSTDVLDNTGSTSQTFSTVATIPVPAINNLPASSPEGTAVALTASATEANTTVAAQGFTYLWQATDADGISATGSGALSFNGTSQFVDLGNPTDLNFSGQITLDAWIMPESTNGLQDIIAHGYQTSPNNAEDFLRISGGYYQVGSWNGGNAFAQAAIPAGDIGQWVNLAGVYNGTQWILYRDGVQVATSGPTTQGALPVSNTDWAIGAAGTGNQRFFQGEIDDLSIWKVGLSAATVRSVMAAAPTANNSGLVAYYPFNETSGNIAIDATGNANNGTLGAISPNNPAADPSRVAGIVLGPSVSVTPGESGTESVTLQAFDAAGGSGVETATFTASPVPIVVNAGGNVVVQQGTLLTRTCSFTDPPGDGPWTATVLFGDGTPLQPLALNGQSFTLRHVFENAGTFTTIVTVTNRNGLSGSFSYTATVAGFTVNNGSPQPSPVTKLVYTFNNPTRVEQGAFELLQNGKLSHVHLKIAPLSDRQTYIITFSGPGVIDGALPAGRYTLITLYKKVHVLLGPPMTANDVNTFASVRGGVHVGKKHVGSSSEQYKGSIEPPKRALAKFAGRTLPHPSVVRPASPLPHLLRSFLEGVKTVR